MSLDPSSIILLVFLHTSFIKNPMKGICCSKPIFKAGHLKDISHDYEL